MNNLSLKIVRIISQSLNFDWELPFKLKEVSSSIGSGFFIDKQGHILTCAHVVDDAKEVFVQLPNEGKDRFKAEVVGLCPEFDMAILKIKDYKNKYYLELGNSDNIKFGEESIALGYPLGQDNLKITKGIISGKEKGDFQTDTPINPGNSGGPLLVKNKVIGINASGFDKASNVSYAKPINQYFLIKEELLKGNRELVIRPKLGITYNYTNDDFLKLLDSKCKKGIYINYINNKSSIYKCGLREKDILCKINKISIDDYGMTNKMWFKDKMTLDEILLTLKKNDRIHIEFTRNGKLMKKIFHFEEFNIPIRWRFPMYEHIENLVMGGLVFMNLSNNHLSIKCFKKYLIKYLKPINKEKPALVISKILPNSIMFNQDVIKQADIIIEVNNQKVDSISSLKKAISKPIVKNKKKYFEIVNSDNKRIAMSLEKIEKDNKIMNSIFNL